VEPIPTQPSPELAEPVTAIARWQIAPEQTPEFEAWVAGIFQESSHHAGYLGTVVIRPPVSGGKRQEWTLVFRFDNYEHLRLWEASPARRAWLARASAFKRTESTFHEVDGLDFWFTLPDASAKSPPRWKIALVTCLALYPLVNTLGWIVTLVVGRLPPLLATAITLPIATLLMTYLIMPQLTRLLARWLYAT
jgi:uncharacterized protein